MFGVRGLQELEDIGSRMDLSDFLDPATIANHPFAFWFVLGFGVLWLMGFSRRKILQDLEILDRIEKMDPDAKARAAVRESIAVWVKITYGWPMAVAALSLVMGLLLVLAALWVAWAGIKTSSVAVVLVGLFALCEGAFLLWYAWRRVQQTEAPHIQALREWKP